MRPKPLAYDAYQLLAAHYAEYIETKPHNAYYDRPAMIAMWPEVRDKCVLDAGCGPGVYAEILVSRGAQVTAIDVSERMIEFARRRLGESADLRLVDLSAPLDEFQSNQFDLINAPLCLDYIHDWRSLFAEFRRILKPGGILQFSCGHPSFDADYFESERYFDIEQVSCTWKGFGIEVEMPSYRRSLQEILMPLIQNEFLIGQIREPMPTAEFLEADQGQVQVLNEAAGISLRSGKSVAHGELAGQVPGLQL